MFNRDISPTSFLIRTNWQRPFFLSSGKGFLSSFQIFSHRSEAIQTRPNQTELQIYSFPFLGAAAVIDPCKVFLTSISLYYIKTILLYIRKTKL
jgi:hypothetical protein